MLVLVMVALHVEAVRDVVLRTNAAVGDAYPPMLGRRTRGVKGDVADVAEVAAVEVEVEGELEVDAVLERAVGDTTLFEVDAEVEIDPVRKRAARADGVDAADMEGEVTAEGAAERGLSGAEVAGVGALDAVRLLDVDVDQEVDAEALIDGAFILMLILDVDVDEDADEDGVDLDGGGKFCAVDVAGIGADVAVVDVDVGVEREGTGL